MLEVVFKWLTCSTFDDVTERLRQQKRHSEEDYEHVTTRRQADRQRTSQAQSAEGDEQATAHRDENHMFARRRVSMPMLMHMPRDVATKTANVFGRRRVSRPMNRL